MITLEEFEHRVRAHYDSVPAEYREYVSGPEVIADALPHPDLEDNFILGECHHHPDWTSDWTGGQPLRSTVVLYYGSFVELAGLDPAFPMDDEIRETVLHEIQHHLEDAAGAGDLHGLDFAQEHNERRRSGHDYAVRFWRAGERLEDERHELWAVDSDVFLEITLSTHQWDRARAEGLRLQDGGEFAFDGWVRHGATSVSATMNGWDCRANGCLRQLLQHNLFSPTL